MEVFRRLERRLESILDGAVAGVFKGPLHPTELAIRLAREADLALVPGEHGPNAPNHYVLAIAPADLEGATPPARLTRWLQDAVEDLAYDRGWRLDGPAVVELTPSADVQRGSPSCHANRTTGQRKPWAVLLGETEIDVTVNQAVVGRGEAVDVVIPDDTASRRHAIVWTEGGQVFVKDLGSANGTWVDGGRVGTAATVVGDASRLTFGNASFIVRRR